MPGWWRATTLIFVDGADKALIASTEGGEHRSIQEPSTQVSFRGPRQGFTESLQTNISMIRRYVKTPDVWVEKMEIGHETNTDVALMYINGICDKKLIKEVRKRLKHIDIDSILESGYIEQLIEDAPFSVFPTVYHTERPDVVAGNLLEGRFAIIVDGTPFVLIAPALFIQFFQSVEDYYSRFDIATSIRVLAGFDFLHFTGGAGDLCGGDDLSPGNDSDAVADCHRGPAGDGAVPGRD